MLVDANSVEHFPLPAPQHHNESQSPGEIHHLPEMGRGAAEGQSSDIMTYSQYVNGSIFSIPKSWSQKSTDDMLMTVYSFVKTFWWVFSVFFTLKTNRFIKARKNEKEKIVQLILSSTHLMQLLNLNLVSRLILTFAL